MELPMLLDSLHAAVAQLLTILKALQQHAQGESIYVQSGVGRHIRHASDHLQALLEAEQKKPIDYNYRTRGSDMESQIDSALAKINAQQKALDWLRHADTQAVITIQSEMSFACTLNGSFQSSLAREMLYLINHTIHHAAYIKLSLQKHQIVLPEDVGLAPCTLSHLKAQACAALAS
jgi:hypothetical protein